jgi:hypothetical protein
MLKACKHFKLGYNGQVYILPNDFVEIFEKNGNGEYGYKTLHIIGIRKSYLEHLKKHSVCLVEVSLTPEALQHLL